MFTYKSLFLFLVIALLCSSQPAQAQQGDVKQIQPSIMVLPFAKEGEDIRTILDEDPNQFIAVTEIQKAFNLREFTTIDFLGKLNAMTTSKALCVVDCQTSIEQQIIENSLADIAIRARMVVNDGSRGSSVTMTLNAIDSYTGGAMSSEVCTSGQFRTDNYGLLAANALGKETEPDGCLNAFMDILQTKFTDIIQNGRSVVVEFRLGNDATITFDDEINDYGDLLSDAIEIWFEDNAYQNYFSIQGRTATSLTVNDVRIPLRDPQTNRNYRPTQFAREIRRFIRGELRYRADTDVNGSTIIITIGQKV